MNKSLTCLILHDMSKYSDSTIAELVAKLPLLEILNLRYLH